MAQSFFYSTISRTRSCSVRGYANFVFNGPIWEILPQYLMDIMVTYSFWGLCESLNGIFGVKKPISNSMAQDIILQYDTFPMVQRLPQSYANVMPPAS